jgi:glycosyltransferase involved in cell wall biosynthesis
MMIGKGIEVIIPSTSPTLLPEISEALERQTIKAINVHLVYDGERRGAAWARNQALINCNSEFVACLDDDCIPPAHWLEAILEAFEIFKADIVGGTYKETDPFLADRRARQSYPKQTTEDKSGLVGAGGNLAFRLDILHQLEAQDGYIFNIAFPMSQDWELVWRLRAMGATTVFLPVPVKHLKQMSAISYFPQQFKRGIGIQGLNRVQKALSGNVPRHRSLLWSDKKSSFWKTALKLIWYKGVGPFDRSNFRSWSYFLRFWVGEKCQSVGFLWGHLKSRSVRQASSSSPSDGKGG